MEFVCSKIIHIPTTVTKYDQYYIIITLACVKNIDKNWNE